MKSKLSCVSLVVIDEMTVEEEAEAVVLVTSSSRTKMDKMMTPLSDSAKSMFKCDNTIDADPCSIVPFTCFTSVNKTCWCKTICLVIVLKNNIYYYYYSIMFDTTLVLSVEDLVLCCGYLKLYNSIYKIYHKIGNVIEKN